MLIKNKVFKIFAVLLFFSSGSSQATTLSPEEQKFRLVSELSIYRGWIEEVVPNYAGTGRERFRALQNQGFQCITKQGNANCRRFADLELSVNEAAVVLTQYQTQSIIEFAAQDTAPELIHDSESYKEYLHRRAVKWGDQQWQTWTVYVSTDVTKLNLRGLNGELEKSLIMNSDGSLEKQAQYRRKRSIRIHEVVNLGVVWRP